MEKKHITIIGGQQKRSVAAIAILLFFACAISMATTDDLTLDATASDRVSVSYDDSGTLAVLGMVGTGRTVLKIWAGLAVWRPGAEVLPGGMGMSEGGGGRLRYTLFGKSGTYKIAVEAVEGDYHDGALSVRISEISAGGSQLSTLGLPRDDFIPIAHDAPHDLITGIDGANTWTGTYRTDGARVRYRLSADPGGVSGSWLTVLYTLLQE